MKNVKSYLLLFVFSFLLIGCEDDSHGEKGYSGTNYVSFNAAGTQRMVVRPETGFEISPVSFGTVKATQEDTQVKLIFDAENSTAVLGVDFDIVSDVVVLEKGKSVGEFGIKVYEDPATPAGKVAKFKISSPTIANAIFRQDLEVTLALSCQFDNEVFPLTYDVDVYAFGDMAPSHVQTLVPVSGAAENTYKFTSAWGPTFVAWATDTPSYNNQYLYSGVLTINCDNTVVVVGDLAWSTGGTGTYDPDTGVIDVVIGQSLFTTAFTANCVFIPRN